MAKSAAESIKKVRVTAAKEPVIVPEAVPAKPTVQKKRTVAAADARKNRSRPTSYSMYLQSMNPLIRKDNPGLSFVEVSKQVAAMWAKLDDAEKDKYKDLASERFEEIKAQRALEPETETTTKADKPKVKRACTGYTLYLKEQWQTSKDAHPEASFTEVSKIIAAQWKVLTPEQKSAYSVAKPAPVAADDDAEMSDEPAVEPEPAVKSKKTKAAPVVVPAPVEPKVEVKKTAGRKRKAAAEPVVEEPAPVEQPKAKRAKKTTEPAKAKKAAEPEPVKDMEVDTPPAETKPAPAKRATTALKLFSTDHKAEFKAKYPTYKPIELNRTIADAWRNADKATKEKYEALASKSATE